MAKFARDEGNVLLSLLSRAIYVLSKLWKRADPFSNVLTWTNLLMKISYEKLFYQSPSIQLDSNPQSSQQLFFVWSFLFLGWRGFELGQQLTIKEVWPESDIRSPWNLRRMSPASMWSWWIQRRMRRDSNPGRRQCARKHSASQKTPKANPMPSNFHKLEKGFTSESKSNSIAISCNQAQRTTLYRQ